MTPDRPPAQEVIDTLVQRWRGNPAVESVLLFGSHAHGFANESSDFDLSVLASEPASVPGEGLRRFRGHLVELFVNTRAFYEKSFQRFHADNSRIAQSQFASAKILFDRRGEALALQRTAREWLDKPRVTQTAQQAEWPKRVIWSRFHRLEHVVESGGPALDFVLHGFVYDVYAKYAAFLGQPVMPTDRLDDYLADDSKRQRYLQEPFSDSDFGETLLQALPRAIRIKKLELARRLKDLALRGMGGFEPEDLPG